MESRPQAWQEGQYNLQRGLADSRQRDQLVRLLRGALLQVPDPAPGRAQEHPRREPDGGHQRAAVEAPERGEVPAGVRPPGDRHHGRHLPQHHPQDNPRQVMIGPNIF